MHAQCTISVTDRHIWIWRDVGLLAPRGSRGLCVYSCICADIDVGRGGRCSVGPVAMPSWHAIELSVILLDFLSAPHVQAL
jgi:hypothetical protein